MSKSAASGLSAALRKALGPFGLDRSPEHWPDVEKRFRKCANRYIFIQENQGHLSRPADVSRQLETVAAAAETLAGALEGLGDTALEWLFASRPPDFERSLARADFDELEEIRRQRDHVFWPEFEIVVRSDPAHSTSPPQDPVSLTERIIAAQKQLIRWRNLAERDPRPATKQGLEKAELNYAIALIARAEPELPSPHPVRAEAAGRRRDMAALALNARDAFLASSPQDKGGEHSPLFGAPTTALAHDCANTILICFGLKGFKKVVSTKNGRFHNLLIAVHQYAMGQDESIPDFSGIVNSINKWRNERLEKLRAERFPDSAAIEEQMTLLEASLGTRRPPPRSSSRRRNPLGE